MTRYTPEVYFKVAVEGLTDEALVSRILDHVGARPSSVYGRRGKQHLRQRISAYNSAAIHSPWFVLVDLDTEKDCAAALKASWLPSVSPNMCFRVAVRAAEAWLIADRKRIAAFLGVPISRVPDDPDSLSNPKDVLVRLAARSRRRDIRDDMVPRDGSGRQVGPAFTSRLIEFIGKENGWRPEAACANSDSLKRSVDRIERLIQDLRQ